MPRHLPIIALAGALAGAALTGAFPGAAAAEPCAADNRTRVAANGECLVIRTYGEPGPRTSLVVLIHGDGYRGGPSDYLYPLAQQVGAAGVVAVGLIRPGYYDSDDHHSTGNSYRDGDNYRADVIDTVAGAILALKNHYRAGRVVVAGHSGGAAVAGVVIGKYPGLADAAVLGACPCDVPRWRIMRRGRNNWHFSLSPHEFTDRVDTKTAVVALTGGDDGNTAPVIAEDYVVRLQVRGIDATFIEVPGVGHSGIVRTDEYKAALGRMLAARP